MDWIITLGLMLCILTGGALSAAQSTDFFKKRIEEPLHSQQTMQVGLAWLLASIVPFWRNHPGIGAITLLLGLVTFLVGCASVYQYGKAKARSERLSAMPNTVAANDDNIRQPAPTTGKAAAKQRKCAARET